MAFAFSDTDIDRIGTVLETTPKREGSLVRFEVRDEESGRRIILEIQTALHLPEDLIDDIPANLVSVYATGQAASSFLQIQGCTGYVAIQDLGEIIFVARRGGSINGLVVEREAGASLYANVNERLLSTDPLTLPPELIMSSVALSLSETLFDDLG